MSAFMQFSQAKRSEVRTPAAEQGVTVLCKSLIPAQTISVRLQYNLHARRGGALWYSLVN